MVVFNTMLAQSEGTHQVIEFSELKFAQNQRRSDQSDKLSTSNLFNPQNSIFQNKKTPKNERWTPQWNINGIFWDILFSRCPLNYLCMSHGILDRTWVYFTKYFLYAFRSVSWYDNSTNSLASLGASVSLIAYYTFYDDALNYVWDLNTLYRLHSTIMK